MPRGIGMYTIKDGKELARRIKELAKQKGVYRTKMVKYELGITPSSVNLWQSGKTKYLSLDVKNKLEKMIDLSDLIE